MAKVKEDDLVLIFHVVRAIFLQLNGARLHLISRASSQAGGEKFAGSADRILKRRIIIPLLERCFDESATFSRVSNSLARIVYRETTLVNLAFRSENGPVCADWATIVELRFGKLIKAVRANLNSQFL